MTFTTSASSFLFLFLSTLVRVTGALRTITLGVDSSSVSFSSGWHPVQAPFFFGDPVAETDGEMEEVQIRLPLNTVSISYYGLTRPYAALYAACLDCNSARQQLQLVDGHDPEGVGGEIKDLVTFTGLDPNIQHILTVINLGDSRFDSTSELTYVSVVAAVQDDATTASPSSMASVTSASVATTSFNTMTTVGVTSMPTLSPGYMGSSDLGSTVSTSTSSSVSTLGGSGVRSNPSAITSGTGTSKTGSSSIGSATMAMSGMSSVDTVTTSASSIAESSAGPSSSTTSASGSGSPTGLSGTMSSPSNDGTGGSLSQKNTVATSLIVVIAILSSTAFLCVLFGIIMVLRRAHMRHEAELRIMQSVESGLITPYMLREPTNTDATSTDPGPNSDFTFRRVSGLSQFSAVDSIIESYHIQAGADSVAHPRRTSVASSVPSDFPPVAPLNVHRRTLSEDGFTSLPPVPMVSTRQLSLQSGGTTAWTSRMPRRSNASGPL